jgi:hypothetical protein
MTSSKERLKISKARFADDEYRRIDLLIPSELTAMRRGQGSTGATPV